jgi:hypothetical protein
MLAYYDSLTALKQDNPDRYLEHTSTVDDRTRSLGRTTTEQCTQRLRDAVVAIKAFHTARLSVEDAESTWAQKKDSKGFFGAIRNRAKRHLDQCRQSMADTRSHATTSYQSARQIPRVGTGLLYEALRVHDQVEASEAGRTATKEKYQATLETLQSEAQ